MEIAANSRRNFFSIIVPIYNVAPYLEKCVSSLSAQIFTDFEVLFVNDGSTDHSLSLLKEVLSDALFSYQVVDQKNQGLSVARNVGFSYSSGRYILFLDSDDFLQEDALEYAFRLLNAYDFVDCLSFARTYVNESYQPIVRSFVAYDFDDEVKLIRGPKLMSDLLSFQNISFTVIDKIFSRDFLAAFSPVIFKPGVNFEDHIFTFYAYKELPEVLVTKRKLLNYLVRSSSIMRTANLKMVDNYLVMLQEFSKSSALFPEQIKDKRLIAQHLLIQIASFYKALYDVKNLTAKNFKDLSVAFKTALVSKGLLPLPLQGFNISKRITALYIGSSLSSSLFFNKLFFYLLGLIGRG